MSTGIFSFRSLQASGHSRDDVRRALARGQLSRVRRGWYAVPTTPDAVVSAARTGGRLTCLAALRLHGAWVLASDDLHVRVADGVSVDRRSVDRVHWTPDRLTPGVDSVQDALRTAVKCADLRSLVIVADSLVNSGLLNEAELTTILSATPRGRRVLQLHDPASQSGIETIVRLGLRRLRVRVRSQVVIAGVGRVDFVVGDRLVVEADGYDWHGDRARFERDRERDRELICLGYVVIRASYSQVTTDLDAVLLAVVAVIRRREHRWRPVHATQLSARRRREAAYPAMRLPSES